jgi:hypothetical protein
MSHSPEVHQAIVKQMFQFMTKQPLAAYGLDRTESLTKSLQDNTYQVRTLLIELGLIICQPETSDGIAQSGAF